MQNRRQIGTEEEALAAVFLKAQGYEILEQNFRCRLGEIDIIARDGSALVFIEVKYRRNAAYGTPAEAVNLRKQQKICRKDRQLAVLLAACFFIFSKNMAYKID